MSLNTKHPFRTNKLSSRSGYENFHFHVYIEEYAKASAGAEQVQDVQFEFLIIWMQRRLALVSFGVRSKLSS